MCHLHRKQPLNTGLVFLNNRKSAACIPGELQAKHVVETTTIQPICSPLWGPLSFFYYCSLDIFSSYRVAWKFCGSFILQIGDFLWFAETNFCGSRWLKFLVGTNFCDSVFKLQNIQVEETLIWYFQLLFYVMLSKVTLLTYLMQNNTVISVISYCTKELNNSKTKQKPIPTIHSKTLFR